MMIVDGLFLKGAKQTGMF